MNKLQCELCGSVEIIKTEENLFKCKSCGCNYTLEQARYLVSGKVTAVQPDFSIRAGMLEKYNGESVTADIPTSVTIIGDDAFSDCPGLLNVAIPSTVYKIGNNAFSGCLGLKNITLPDSISSFGYGSFRNCSKLSSVDIPKNTTVLTSHLFENCTSLKSVTLHSEITKIESYAFSGCTELEEIILPRNVAEIDAFAFSGCIKLKKIYIPGSVDVFGNDVFRNCDELKEIECLSPAVLPYLVRKYSPAVDINNYMLNNLCRHCGGSFKGIFAKKCRICDTQKDYKVKKGKIVLK